MGFAGWLALSEPTAGGDFHPAPKAMNRSVAASLPQGPGLVNQWRLETADLLIECR